MDLDLITIVRTLQEFQKLKEMLFDESQLFLFNFIPRPNLLGTDYFKNRLKSKFYYHPEGVKSQKSLIRDYFTRKKFKTEGFKTQKNKPNQQKNVIFDERSTKK